MNTNSIMAIDNFNSEEILSIVDRAIKPDYLSKIQELVLLRSLEGKTYAEIADDHSYDSEYIKRVGSELWQLLTRAFDKPITKSNLQQFFRRHTLSFQEQAISPQLSNNDRECTPQPKLLKQPRQDWGTAPDVATFHGRTEELAELSKYANEECHQLILILGMVGIGKTFLAAKFAEQFGQEFEYVIWRSLRNTPSVEELLESYLRFFYEDLSDHPATLDDKLLRFVDFLRQHRCLLVIDDLHFILSNDRSSYYREGCGKYELLLRLLASTRHQSLVVFTSWQKPHKMALHTNKVGWLVLKGLPSSILDKIFAAQLGGNCSQRQILYETYAYNPQLLELTAFIIHEVFHGSINDFLQHEPKIFDGILTLLNQQFETLSAVEKEITYWLTIYGAPTHLSRIANHLVQPVSRTKLLEALMSLNQGGFIEQQGVYYSVNPLIRNYLSSKFVSALF